MQKKSRIEAGKSLSATYPAAKRKTALTISVFSLCYEQGMEWKKILTMEDGKKNVFHSIPCPGYKYTLRYFSIQSAKIALMFILEKWKTKRKIFAGNFF